MKLVETIMHQRKYVSQSGGKGRLDLILFDSIRYDTRHPHIQGGKLHRSRDGQHGKGRYSGASGRLVVWSRLVRVTIPLSGNTVGWERSKGSAFGCNPPLLPSRSQIQLLLV